MVSKKYKQQWALWTNGLFKTVLTGIVASLAVFVANGSLDLKMSWRDSMMTVGAAVLGHLVGWFQESPLPPLIDVEEVTVQDTHTTTTTTTTMPAPPTVEGQS